MSLTIYLQGGMANLMFQLGFGISQAKRLGVDLQLDVTSFKHDSMRRYNLDLWEGVNYKIVGGTRPTIFEQSMPYNPGFINSIKDGDCVKGYFQSEKFIQDVRPELLEIFQPRQPLSYSGSILRDRLIETGHHSAFLTIRRSDYLVKQDFHGVLPMSYYEKALAKLEETVSDPQILVFSDDPKWVHDNFRISYDYILAGSFNQTRPDRVGREDEDIYLMSLCRNAIMANSSFSWMGAWLYKGKEAGRVVVGPNQWFTDSSVDSRDIIPERWIRL